MANQELSMPRSTQRIDRCERDDGRNDRKQDDRLEEEILAEDSILTNTNADSEPRKTSWKTAISSETPQTFPASS